MPTTIPAVLQVRRDTTANWASANPILASGEIGLDTTLGTFKIGDGVTAWNFLSFYSSGGLTDGDKGDITVSSSGTVWTIDNSAVTNAKVATGIDATKLADGSVTNTELQYINTLSSNAQTQLDGKQPLATVLTNTTASFTTAQETKLAGIAAGAEVNVNADWNAVSGDAEILNKPTIPTQYTDEMAQDAIGAMIDSSLNYVDGTPLLQRAALTGEATASAGSNSVTLTNSAVIGKVLTGFTAGAGTVAATDTILQAFQKVVGNISALVTGVSSVFGRTGAVTAQSGDYTTAQVTESGNLYFTDERAQDAVGAMVDSSLTYVDATPLLQRAALTGDVTASAGSNATTIANSAVTNVKMANMAAGTIKGNNTGGAAAPSDLTVAQVKTLLAITNADVAGLGTLATQNGTFSGTSSGTNTGDQNLFSTIAVSGQSNVVADSTSDTLTLVAGSNITITTDAATDSVTIAASGGGGGGSGDVVGPASATDNALVRFDSTTGKLIQNSASALSDDGALTLTNNSGANTGMVSAYNWVRLASNYTLTSQTAAQKLFNTTTNGALTLPTGVYFFESLIYLLSMSATSGNAAFHLLGGGTATLDSILFQSTGKDNTAPTSTNTQNGGVSVTQNTVASMATAGTGTGMEAALRGTFTVTASGTIIPSIALVTAAAAIVQAGSYFKCWRAGDNGTNSMGAWT